MKNQNYQEGFIKNIVMLGILVLLAIGYTVFDNGSKEEKVTEGEGDIPAVIATSTPSIDIIGTKPINLGTSTVSNVYVKPPSLNRPITVPPQMNKEIADLLSAKIASTTEALKKDSEDSSLWFDLALLRKMFEDYEGAREIWEFLNKKFPSNSHSFANLGSLYHLYLKDYPKAEANYKIAVKNEPSRIDLYRNLYELYTYSYKQGTTAGRDILLEGLKKNSKNPDLSTLLGDYYLAKGDQTNALKYYNDALASSRIVNPNVVPALEDKIRSIESSLQSSSTSPSTP